MCKLKNINKFTILLILVMLLLAAVSCSVQPMNSNSGPVPEAAQETPQTKGSETSEDVGENTSSPVTEESYYSYQEIYPAVSSTAKEAKWGYIDQTGTVLITPQFSQAYPFQKNQLAVAGRGNNVGLIDLWGNFILEPSYNYINDYQEGLAIAHDQEGAVVLNESGKVISDKYSFVGNYNNRRASYSIQNPDESYLYGYLNETGKPVIEATYEMATDFWEGRAVVLTENGVYELIDIMGKTILGLNYQYVGNISDGMMRFRSVEGGKYGYLDNDGNIAIQPVFTECNDFIGINAVVNTSEDYSNHRKGLINKNGDFVIQPQYSEILQLGEERVALGTPIDPDNIYIGSKYALATVDGKLLTDFAFFSIGQFQDGIASVHDNTATYFIDTTGSRIENLPSAEGAGTIKKMGSLIYAEIDQRTFYMNENGKLVYQPSTCITLGNSAQICEKKYKPNRNYIVYYPELSDLPNLKVQETVNAELKEMWTYASVEPVKPTDNLDYIYDSSFHVSFNRKNLLELLKTGYNYPIGAAHGMPIQEYVHINTATGTFYELSDLFRDGSDYTSVLTKIVKKQIEILSKSDDYWISGFVEIRPQQPFFLTEDALNLYFTPYEIAPYAAGFPAFKVTFEEISELIDKNGDFWLSFN